MFVYYNIIINNKRSVFAMTPQNIGFVCLYK